MKKLLLHIPHASTRIPLKEGYCVSEAVLQQELLKLTDWYTDDLFENTIDLSCKAPFSRIFCDAERFANDSQEVMAQFGMGVLYEKTDSGALLRNVSPELRTRILNDYYWPHHAQLTEQVQQQLEVSGYAIIVDCHSFPQVPLQRTLDTSGYRPDFNIGTSAYHTPPHMIAAAVDFFSQKGFSLGIDRPYSGTLVPMEFHNKNRNVQSIMLEVNRSLYLRESTNEKSEQYLEIKKIIQDFLKLIRNN